MATYVLGDVHGQIGPLLRLVERIGADPRRDELWMVGDLVNRGPESLAVLRWARRQTGRFGERFVVVLGNHDLRLLTFHAGLGRPRARDMLDDVLGAPDRGELCEWLRSCSLLHRRGDDVLVHAGLLPSWTLGNAAKRAREAEDVLRGVDADVLLGDWRRRQAVDDTRRERRRRTLSILTTLRTCTAEGELCEWNGPPEGAPRGCLPWFEVPGRRSARARIVFGHWAAMGLRIEPRIKALDSGAAWGRQLSALRLEDGALFHEDVDAHHSK